MKKNHVLSAFAFVVMLAMLPLAFYGQSEGKANEKPKTSFDRHWFFLGDAGLSLFHGDLNEYGFAPDPRYYKLNGNLGLGYQLGSVIGFYGKIGGGQLAGEKEWRNAKLEQSSFFDGNINLSLNFVNLVWGYNPDRIFTFAPHFGFGQAHWKARAVDLTTGAVISEVGYDANTPEKGWMGNRASAFTVPIGADLNFKVNEKLDIYADYTFNFLDSDRLDAFMDDGSSPAHKREGTVVSDMYAHFNVGLRFKLMSSSVKAMADKFGNVIIETIPDPLVERGDSVEVTIKITFPPKYFQRNAVMNFTPVLTYDAGAVAFKQVNFKGESVTGDGLLVNYSNGGTFTYTDKIPYQPEFNVSELVVAPLIYPTKSIVNTTRESIQHAERFYAADQRKLADGVIYTSKRIDDKVQTVSAPHGYEKVTILTEEAVIYFPKNFYNLNWNLPLNQKTENKEALAAVANNLKKGYELKDITVAGWASPEGEETFNNNLSSNRAGSAISHLNREFEKLLRKKDNELPFKKTTEINYDKSGNGPDWNGFMAAIEASDIKDKNAILNVVRSAEVSQREQEIRNMILIYPELEKDILPALRRAMIAVNTFEPKKTDEEIAQLATSDPAVLQLNELLYAATLTEDLRTQKMIYASTMELHPKCARAVINAAEVEFLLGNTTEAKALLEKAETMTDKAPSLYNNIAVINIVERDFVAAENNLNKAKALGGDTDYNMGVVNIFKGDYAKAVNLMQSNNCDYNLALAQLLNKDHAAAKATLDCAPESVKVSYLKAVLAARDNDSAAVYSNLMEAIQKDGTYKNVAKGDREFIKYFSEPDFQAVVK